MLLAFLHDVHFFHLNFPSLRVAESHTNHNHSVPDATQLGQNAIQLFRGRLYRKFDIVQVLYGVWDFIVIQERKSADL